MATPKLRKLEVSYCGELQAASFVLLPSLISDLHLIVAQLEVLENVTAMFSTTSFNSSKQQIHGVPYSRRNLRRMWQAELELLLRPEVGRASSNHL